MNRRQSSLIPSTVSQYSPNSSLEPLIPLFFLLATRPLRISAYVGHAIPTCLNTSDPSAAKTMPLSALIVSTAAFVKCSPSLQKTDFPLRPRLNRRFFLKEDLTCITAEPASMRSPVKGFVLHPWPLEAEDL